MLNQPSAAGTHYTPSSLLAVFSCPQKYSRPHPDHSRSKSLSSCFVCLWCWWDWRLCSRLQCCQCYLHCSVDEAMPRWTAGTWDRRSKGALFETALRSRWFGVWLWTTPGVSSGEATMGSKIQQPSFFMVYQIYNVHWIQSRTFKYEKGVIL